MPEVEEEAVRRPRPRRLDAAALALFGLVLVVSTAPSAGSAPDNAAKTPVADNAATGANVAAIRDAISRTISSYGNDVQEAYHRELIRNGKIEGEITVAFTVKPDGEVDDVRAEKSSLNWPPLEQEILNRVKAWKFPPFTGTPVRATVPYKFGPR